MSSISLGWPMLTAKEYHWFTRANSHEDLGVSEGDTWIASYYWSWSGGVAMPKRYYGGFCEGAALVTSVAASGVDCLTAMLQTEIA